MRIFILEDDSQRVNNFVELLHKHTLDITENAYTAMELLDEKDYDLILLDHDLGEGNGSGSLVAAFLAQLPELHAIIAIHSWNVPASNAMIGYLPQAYQVPYNTEAFYEFMRQVP